MNNIVKFNSCLTYIYTGEYFEDCPVTKNGKPLEIKPMDKTYINRQLEYMETTENKEIINDCWYRIATNIGEKLWSRKEYLDIISQRKLTYSQILKVKRFLANHQWL